MTSPLSPSLSFAKRALAPAVLLVAVTRTSNAEAQEPTSPAPALSAPPVPPTSPLPADTAPPPPDAPRAVITEHERTPLATQGAELPAEPIAPRPPPPRGDISYADDGYPLAGWHGGVFYVRDRTDTFRLYVQGRLQVDQYNYLGPGVSDTALKSNIFLRRIRPELSGEFLKVWQFYIAGDWGQSSVDNPTATNESSAAAAGKAPAAATARYAPAQTVSIKAQATDAYINYHPAAEFNIQVGQYNPPFTMEAVMSEKTMPLLERNLGSRLLAAPTVKEIGAMGWGEAAAHRVYYALGVFDGDGQDRPNVDNRFDAMGRVVVRPFVDDADSPVRGLHVGASFRYGSRDPNRVVYDVAPMTTQAGYQFWSPTYTGSKGLTHILPAGLQRGVAGEARIPFSIFDLTGEVLAVDFHTREAVDGYQATNTERLGALGGYTYYVQLGAWLLGPRDVTGLPGFNLPTHVDFAVPDPVSPPQALQLLVRWEQLHLNYNSASRNGSIDALKNADGEIQVNVLSAAANYWATRFVRLTAQYSLDAFPGSEPVSATSKGGLAQTASQRALAPGNTLAPGVNDAARDGAHVLHELLFRVAVGF